MGLRSIDDVHSLILLTLIDDYETFPI
jgi:hypothetical protein